MEQDTISRAHKIRLVPNKAQAEYLRRACGVRRMAFNWALAAWNEQYAAHLADKEKVAKPSWMELQKRFNAIKGETWPWIREISSNVPNHAIKDVGTAWQNFWRGLKSGRHVGKPQFACRGRHERFYVHNQQLKCDGPRINFGKGVGWIKIREALRFDGRIVSATISRDGDEWYVSIQVDVPHTAAIHQHSGTAVGIDVGISHLATTSDGEHLSLPTKALEVLQKRLLRQQRKLSRRWSGKIKKGHADKALRDDDGKLLPKSNRFVAQSNRVGKLHRRIARIRQDALHNSTTRLAGQYETIYIEELQVKNMTRAAKGKGTKAKAGLNRRMLNSAVREFRRQLEYKSEAVSGCVLSVDPAYTSQTCCKCGHVDSANRLTQSEFGCVGCGYSDNADRNAAKNILSKGRGMCAPNRPRKRSTRVENRKTKATSVDLANSEKRETHLISVPLFEASKESKTITSQSLMADLVKAAPK
jgi:putative transposase